MKARENEGRGCQGSRSPETVPLKWELQKWPIKGPAIAVTEGGALEPSLALLPRPQRGKEAGPLKACSLRGR